MAPGGPVTLPGGLVQAHLVLGRQLHQLSQGHVGAHHTQEDAVGSLEGNASFRGDQASHARGQTEPTAFPEPEEEATWT